MAKKSWDDGMPTFQMDDLQAVGGKTASSKLKTAGCKLDEPRKHTRKSENREYQLALNTRNAVKEIEKLPDPGWSLHMVMRGNFNAWDLVPAMMKLTGLPIQELHVATLGFNREQTDQLDEFLGNGKIKAIRFVCSSYFRSVDTEIFDHLAAVIRKHGGRVAATRCHAKILGFNFGEKGPLILAESSANLRSCRNLEQLTIHNDGELLKFHAGWIDEVLDQAESKL